MPRVGFCAVKDLPSSIQDALASVGYGRKDVAVESAEQVSICDPGGAGRKAFAILLDLATGESKTHWGSWGGSNMFNPQNPIDLDDSEHAMTPGGAVISGTIGQTTYARVILHPQNVAKLLPPAWSDVTDKERKILAAVGGLKSGPYRKEALARLQATDADMDTLVQKGLLSKNKAGAISITTAGKNARGDERVY